MYWLPPIDNGTTNIDANNTVDITGFIKRLGLTLGAEDARLACTSSTAFIGSFNTVSNTNAKLIAIEIGGIIVERNADLPVDSNEPPSANSACCASSTFRYSVVLRLILGSMMCCLNSRLFQSASVGLTYNSFISRLIRC